MRKKIYEDTSLNAWIKLPAGTVQWYHHTSIALLHLIEQVFEDFNPSSDRSFAT